MLVLHLTRRHVITCDVFVYIHVHMCMVIFCGNVWCTYTMYGVCKRLICAYVLCVAKSVSVCIYVHNMCVHVCVCLCIGLDVIISTLYNNTHVYNKSSIIPFTMCLYDIIIVIQYIHIIICV